MCQTLCQVHGIWSRWVHRCSPCKPQNAHKNHRQCYPNILELNCKWWPTKWIQAFFNINTFFFFKLIANLKIQNNLHKNLGALEILATLSSFSARQQSAKTELYLLITFHVHNSSMIVMGFPGGASGKEPACQCNGGDRRHADLIPGLGQSPGGGRSNPLQYSCLENAMDRWAWQAMVHRVAKSWTRHNWSDLACMHTWLSSHRCPWCRGTTER